MASSQTLPQSVWPSKALPAPNTSDVLAQLADFLQKLGYDKTVKALLKESKGKDAIVDISAWSSNLKGQSPANQSLGDLYVDFLLQDAASDDDDDDDEKDSSSESDDDASESKTSQSGSSSDDSDSESEDEVSSKSVETKVKQSTAVSKDLKRKRDVEPESESESDSDSSSSESESPDEAPASKKAKKTGKSASDSSESDEDSSSDEDSDEEDAAEANSVTSDTSDSDSSSESESESESEEETPKVQKPTVKKNAKPSKATQKSTQERGSISAASSETITGSPQPNVQAESMHPSRQQRMQPPAVSNVTNDGSNKKINEPFSRIPKNTAVDPRFSSNAYVPYDYANRAHQDLIITKGKGFTKEKNKKKRGSYRGGTIDTTPKGIKFDD